MSGVTWIEEERVGLGEVYQGTLGATKYTAYSQLLFSNPPLGWQFNVIDSFGKVIFTEQRGNASEGWWPVSGALIHAVALWDKYFTVADRQKARVCVYVVSRPAETLTPFDYVIVKERGRAQFGTSPPFSTQFAYDGLKGSDGKGVFLVDPPPCSSTPQVNVSTSNAVQDVTCTQFCDNLYGPSGSYPNAVTHAQCIAKCGLKVTQYLPLTPVPQIPTVPFRPGMTTVVYPPAAIPRPPIQRIAGNEDKSALGAAAAVATSGFVPAVIVLGILGLAVYGLVKFAQSHDAAGALQQNARRKKTKLDELKEELPPGFSVDTYSPGDGVTRYRFFDKPNQDYFGGSHPLYTALGYKEAYTYARGLQRLSSNPGRKRRVRARRGRRLALGRYRRPVRRRRRRRVRRRRRS